MYVCDTERVRSSKAPGRRRRHSTEQGGLRRAHPQDPGIIPGLPRHHYFRLSCGYRHTREKVIERRNI